LAFYFIIVFILIFLGLVLPYSNHLKPDRAYKIIDIVAVTNKAKYNYREYYVETPARKVPERIFDYFVNPMVKRFMVVHDWFS